MAEAGFEGELSKEGLAQKIIVRAKTRLEEDHSRGYNSHSTWQPDAVFEERIDPRTHRPFLHLWTRGDSWDWKPEEVMIGILSGGVYGQSASREHGEVFIRHGDSQQEYSIEKLYIKFDDAATLFKRCGKTLGFTERETTELFWKFYEEALTYPNKEYLHQKIRGSFGENPSLIAKFFKEKPGFGKPSEKKPTGSSEDIEQLKREVDLYKSELRSARERVERKDREIERQKAETISAVREMAKLNREIADLKGGIPRNEQSPQTEYERSLKTIGLSESDLRGLNEEQIKTLLGAVKRGFFGAFSQDRFLNDPVLGKRAEEKLKNIGQALRVVGEHNKVKIK